MRNPALFWNPQTMRGLANKKKPQPTAPRERSADKRK